MGRFYAPPPTSYNRLDVERDSADKSAMTIKQRGTWPAVALKLEGALIGEGLACWGEIAFLMAKVSFDADIFGDHTTEYSLCQ